MATGTALSRRQTIADDLHNQITTGRLKGGDRLPSETSLASHYQVSTPTLRSALALLQAEGLIEKIHGKGNFVRHPLRRITYIGGGRTCAETAGATPQLHVTVHTTQLQAQGNLLALLEVPAGTRLTEFLCIRHEGKSPHSLARVYIPGDSAPRLTACDFPPCSYAEVEARLTAHRPPSTEIRERVTARLPTPEEAVTLRISPTLSILAISRLAVDSTGHVVEAALLALPGDRADAYFITHPTIEKQRREG
ncbi:GntR family transcriptional regulator [Streptomyces sp. NBC_01016]|uniref:GntR family transcriptional regulator n=1 Tax=Streptomyces sp. NBC_01016 TaxID=2903720 RepID=UPI00225BFB84|nr:GntR family transcriptional regulator [Streptomyces sp. NBC_01016]MCX4829673.1 GntR family transcriptional regulator [Streptomyces sp. NBC_01016]